MSEVPVGICPEHGVVYGDDVNFGFPEPATCGKEECSYELLEVALEDEEKIEKYVETRKEEA